MSLFHLLAHEPGAALARADPFAGEPLLRLVDPAARRGGRVAWPRLGLLWAGMTLVTAALAAVQPSHGFDRLGEMAWGGRGLLGDIDLQGLSVVWACYLLVIVYARRLVGSLIVALERTEVVAPRDGEPWTPRPRGRLLRLVEQITRVTPARAVWWGAGLVAANVALNVPSALADGVQNWRTDPLAPGTWLAWLGSAAEQPNLAGLWHLGVASPAAGYLLLLLARLYVVFACLSEDIGVDATLRITPPHPDGTGGLLPIGQAALFMSLAIFVSGLGLTVIALQAIASATPFNAYFILLCVMYLGIGPLLFFLPQWPLRRAMIRAKLDYLVEAEKLYRTVQAGHARELADRRFDSGALQGQASLGALMTQARDMTVWPFDRRTFRRFFALLVSPISPVILQRLSPLFRDVPVLRDLFGVFLQG